MKYSCYYLIHRRCFICIYMLFYTIFGTNLLTKIPVLVSVFSLYLSFTKKEYQTESNWRANFWRFFMDQKKPMEHRRWTRRVPSRPRGWRARPLPRAFLVASLTWTPSLLGCFPSKNNFSRRFHSVSTPFDIPFLRNTETKEKTETGTGLWVNSLVPKII